MVVRFALDRRSGQKRQGVVHGLTVRPFPTVVIGMVGGLIVGMTSVGSGSLMIVLLLFLYPMIGANQLVGTDLTQAVPLTAAAALGALAFGHVEFAVTTSIIVGSVPGVLVGSFLSSRAPDKYIRPAITFVIFASGLKYVGLGTTALGWVLCAHPSRRGGGVARLSPSLAERDWPDHRRPAGHHPGRVGPDRMKAEKRLVFTRPVGEIQQSGSGQRSLRV